MRRSLSAITCTLLVAMLTACSGDNPSPTVVGLSCHGDFGAPVTLVVGSRANSEKPSVPDDLWVLVRNAAIAHNVVNVVRVDGDPTVVLSAKFDTNAKNALAQARDLDYFLSAMKRAIAEIRPKAPEADLLRALDLAAQKTPAGGTIAVIDSGLQTAGSIRFQDSGMFSADPREIADYLNKNGLIPDMENRSLLFIGLGLTAKPQPDLDQAARNKVIDIWEFIGEAGRAACVDSINGSAVGVSVDGVLPVSVVTPPATATFEPCGVTVLDESGRVGFLPDKAQFRDPAAASMTLKTLAEIVKKGRQRIILTGTTASVGDGTQLSKARALAVADELVSLGVPAESLTTVGAGSKSRFYVNDRNDNGDLIPAAAARNRSVVVELVCE